MGRRRDSSLAMALASVSPKLVIGRVLCAGAFSVGLFGMALHAKPGVGYADIQSIFNAHCTRCHAGPDASGGLSLDTYANVMKGRVLIPGDSGNSVLVARLLGRGGKPQMPMGFTALSSREIELIKAWIDQGCKDNASKAVHWAYMKPVLPKIPMVRNARWVRNPIDAFVMQRLEQE